MPKQTELSTVKNKSFFANNDNYAQNVATIDTYARIRAAVDAELYGLNEVLDVGNGGIFEYDISAVQRLTAVDLFLDDIDQSQYPGNVHFVQGSALELPFERHSFDAVLVVMLIHHLTGSTVKESARNAQRCFDECLRVLRPNGKFILVESCVPSWFYAFERSVFRFTSRTIGRVITHPTTLQYPASMIHRMLASTFQNVTVKQIPKGRFVLQFGVKVPSFVTPVQPYVFSCTRREIVF